MVRNSTILTASITKEQSDALEVLNLSPSELLQDAIEQQIARSKNVLPQIKELELKISKLVKQIEHLFAFINHKGIEHKEYYDFVNNRENVA
jgi:hypothetical protein